MKKISLFVIFLLVSLLLAGASVLLQPKKLKPLLIGSNVWLGYEPIYLARSKNYFASETIRLVEYTSATDVLRGMKNNVLDGAFLTLDEALLLAQTGLDLQIILIADVSDGGDALLGAPNLGNMADLRGKRIGYEGNALGAFFLSRALQINKIEPSSVHLKTITFSHHQQAFEQGLVDAVVTQEPIRTHLLRWGARELFSSKEIPGEIVDVLVVRRSSLEEKPVAVHQLLMGWFNAIELLNHAPLEAYPLMTHRLNLTNEELHAAYQGIILPDRASNLLLLQGPPPRLTQTLQNLHRIMLEHDLLQLPKIPEDFINPQPLLGIPK